MFTNLIKKIVLFIGNIRWKTNDNLTPSMLADIRSMLVKDYYIILTKRKSHLSTFFINLADWFLTGKFGYWSHALLNLEDEVASDDDFRLMEATGTGVHYSSFNEVFDVQSVALLIPKTMDVIYWTELLGRAKLQLGKEYDTLFDIRSTTKLSCAELVRLVLQGEPDYETNFSNFEELITKSKNLTPQMLADCGDFKIVYFTEV